MAGRAAAAATDRRIWRDAVHSTFGLVAAQNGQFGASVSATARIGIALGSRRGQANRHIAYPGERDRWRLQAVVGVPLADRTAPFA
jgi:hypothetical protein